MLSRLKVYFDRVPSQKARLQWLMYCRGISLAPLTLVLRDPDCLDEVLVSTRYVHIGALHVPHVGNKLFEVLGELCLFLRSVKKRFEPSELCAELVSPILFPKNALE